MKQKHIFKTLLTLLLMVAAGGSAWAQIFTIEASHNSTNNKTTFTITRSGSSLPAQTIKYRTVNLSAYAGQHYTARSVQRTFTENQTTDTIIVTELTPSTDAYKYQNSTQRSYRFEVLDVNGFKLASKDRTYTTGTQFSNAKVSSSVSNLVTMTSSGNFSSGMSSGKYLDVSYTPPTDSVQASGKTLAGYVLIDDSYDYKRKWATVSTSNLISNTNASASYLKNIGYKIYATVCFTEKEKDDGYQYLQIVAGPASHAFDGADSNGKVNYNHPNNAAYTVCFEFADNSNSEGKIYFPHRGTTSSEFSNSNGRLWQQKYKSGYDGNGSVVLDPDVSYITTRFDAGGDNDDTWGYKDFFVRMALCDATAPTLYGNNKNGITVSAGPYIVGNTFYISVPFSEIVTTATYSNNKKLVTTWGDATYFSGDGTNVITFKGTINASSNMTLAITSVQCNFNDLSGNYYQGLGSSNYTDSFDKTFSGVTCSATYTLAATNTAFSALDGDYWVSDNVHLPQPHPSTFYFYKGIVNSTNQVSLAETTDYTMSWSDNTAAGTGTATATGAGSYTGSVSTTFPIRWSTYTVAFHSNGSTGIPATGTMSDQNFQYGVAQNLTANNFSRTGFTFAGWNTAPDGSGTAYSDGQSVTGLNPADGGTVDLYAQWAVIPWTGNGTDADDPYIILYASQLDSLAATVNSGTNYSGTFFQLGADITYGTEGLGDEENNYTAIGKGSSYPFSGTFDGQGHTVSGLHIQKDRNAQSSICNYRALFGNISNGTVQNVVLDNSVFSGRMYIGGIVGYADNSTISGCLVTNTSVNSVLTNYLGVIVGTYTNTVTLSSNYYRNCVKSGNTTGIGVWHNDVDGARSVHTLTLPADVSASGESIVIDNVTYYASNTPVTLTYSGTPGYSVSYSYNDGSDHAISGNTFTMPAADGVTVTATLTDRWGIASGHDGTSEAMAYLISDTVGLNLLARNVNGTHGYTANGFNGKFFRLTNNITYSTEGLGATESNYTAIGISWPYFRGTFDGDNHTISGIRIYKGGTTNADGYQGIFGQVKGGTIKNLTLTDAVITGWQNVGGIVGYISNYAGVGGIIDNCHVTGSVTLHAVANNAGFHGGIVGNVNGGSVSGCTSAATLSYASGISGCTAYGGIVGSLNGNLHNCLVFGANISGTNIVGAIVGLKSFEYTYSANYYRDCTVNGTVGATGVGIGGEQDNTTPHDIDGVRSLHTLTLGDGVSATGSETKVIGNTTYYASASTVTLSYGGTPASGYSHSGYSYQLNTEHLTLNTDSFTMPSADLTVSAAFTPIVYNITYNLGGGSASNPATYTIETPDFTLNNPTREGYTFLGWTGTGLDAATTTVTIAQGSTGDRSYTATWTPIVYNITYNLGGGNLATPNPVTYTIETPDFTLNNPTREDYIFAGWTGTGLDAATTTVTVAQGSTGDRSYTATWTPIVYNITYDLAGGSASNPATYTIETPDFTLNNPTREGYTFAGWTGTGLDAATTSVTIAQGSTGNRSYTATWEVIPWTGSGSESNPYIILYASQLDLLATLVNGGNEFNNTFFKLGADINYTHTTDWDDANSTENNYTAIGKSLSFSFNGTLDGQGHTVSGIRIYKTNTDYQGLFGYLDNDARVKNVAVANARITGSQNVGGIAGRNDGNINNCVSSSVAVTATNSGNAYCGGITGYGIWGDISNCLVLNASVSGSSNYIGAVAGDAGTSDISYSLYYNCTVGGVENATNVGCNGSDWYSDFHLVPAYRLTLAPNVTASNTFAYGEHYYIARNRIVTLDYSGAVDYDQAVVYSAGGNELPLNSFTVTADTVVTAAVVTAIQTIPYSYDFEDETPFRYWRPLTGSYYLTHRGYNNTNCLGIFGTTSNLMLLPPFDTEVNTLMLNLKFRSSGNNENYGTFSVGYVTDAADASTFTAVATYSYAESQGNWTQKTEYFTGIPAGARLALRSNPTYSNYYWYVDDIEVAVAPSCIPPQDLTLTTMDAVSASFTWRTVNGAQWEYCLLDSDREPVDADFVASTTASSVSFDNLTPVTVYRFHLRRRCDAQSTSTVGTLNFTTPALVPFADDFEATQCRWTVKANSTNCWCQGSAVNNGGSQALYISDDNGTHRHSSYGSGYFYAYMRFSLAAGVYAFSYDWTNNDYGFLRVALVPDNIDLDKSNISNYLNNSSNPPSGWLWLDGNGRLQYHPDWVPRTEVVDVSAAGLYKMVFFWYNYGECDYPAAVDNVRVTIPRTFTTAGRWDVASNWSPAGVPAADEIVVVRAAATIPSGCVAMANNISVGNDGSLILADGGQLYTHSSNLPITVQKEVRANQWSAFALIGYYSYSPNNVDNLTSAAYDLFGYDEPSATWVNKKNNWLNIIQGYIYRRAADATLSYDNNVYGSTNFGITVYRQYGDDALKGFNLVGNMTPHNVVKGSGLYLQSNASWATGYYTLEADGSWRAHPDSDSIAPGQAVLIQLTASNESYVNFDNALDWPSNSKGGKKAESGNETLAFTVGNGEHSDVAYAMFGEADGLRKFGHQNADLPSLSIVDGDSRYAIAPIADSVESFDMAFRGKAGEYTLTAAGISGKTGYLHLIDRFTGADIDLLKDSSYSFAVSEQLAVGSWQTPRFLVKLSPDTHHSSLITLHFAHLEGAHLVVTGQGTLTAYDIMGRELFRKELTTHHSSLNTRLFPSPGVYILNLNGHSQKVVIE